jgi:hypothetical protein
MIEGPTVTHVSGVPLTISASTPHSALQVGRDEVVIQPGQSLTIALVFNCATQSGIETELTISARTPGGITHTTNVLVVAQISR